MRGPIVAIIVFIAVFLGLLSFMPQQKRLSTAKEAAIPLAATSRAEPEILIATPRKTTLYRDVSGHFLTDAMVDGRAVRFMVDTGATSVVLTMADAQRAGIPFDPATFTVIGRGVSGDVRGTMIKLQSLTIGDHEVRDVEAAIVADGLDISLLGQSWLSKIGTVQISGDVMTLG